MGLQSSRVAARLPRVWYSDAMNKKNCSVADCQRDGRMTRGYCSMHYQRFMKYGDPHGGIAKYTDWREALEKRVRREGDCIVWDGHVNQHGYGRINVGGNRRRVVHHLAWEQAHGPVPDGMEVDHVCFNRACINVRHLRVVTRSDNARHRKGAQPNSKSGVRNVHAYKGGRWYVRLKVAGKHRNFGVYDTIEEAAEVAAQARREVFGRP